MKPRSSFSAGRAVQHTYRGYGSSGKSKPRAVTAETVDLSPAASAAEAFQAAGTAALHELIACRSRFKTSAPETLHQMRIALRKLNAVIRLFSSVAPLRQGKFIASELKWVGKELARARDFDVFVEEMLLPLRRKCPHDISVAMFSRVCLRHRKREYKRSKTALASMRFSRLLVAIAEWIEAAGRRRKAQGKQSAHEVVAERLSALKKKMRSGRHIKKLDRHHLHKLRLRAKRMRYAIECVEQLYPDRKSRNRMDKMAAALRRLQSSLGGMNDLAIAGDIFDAIMKDSKFHGRTKDSAANVRLMSLIFGSHKRRPSKLLEKSADAYVQYARTKPFWL
jgi:CHAD domain-containing protein